VWADIRAEHVARAGGEAAVEAGKQELLAIALGHRLAEVRRARGLTQQQVADQMGITKGRVSPVGGRQVIDEAAGRCSDLACNSTRPPTRSSRSSAKRLPSSKTVDRIATNPTSLT
jgi:transcriptional regulator with XRE-family HTH domain